MSIEVDPRICNAWCRFRKYILQLYDRPSAPLKLKIRMLLIRAEVLYCTVLEIMRNGCVTSSPRAWHYETLHLVHHSVQTRFIGWRKNRADHPISHPDKLMKTGSESIEAIMRRRRILLLLLLAGIVEGMEDTRLPKCVMVGKVVGGAGFVGEGQEKVRAGYLLDDLIAFGINTHQWATPAQGKGEWRNTAKQGAKIGAKHFMVKWIAEDKVGARLRHEVVRPNVPGRTNDRIS